MICELCHNPIIFYAHQRPVDGRMKFWHPECCPDCVPVTSPEPER